jgi:pyrophosphatase PpaX
VLYFPGGVLGAFRVSNLTKNGKYMLRSRLPSLKTLRGKKTKFKCVIFDMDGTLTETNQLIFDSFNYIARKYKKKTYSPAEIVAMFGPPEEGALLDVVGEDEIDQAMKEYLSYYRRHHKELARLYPGILNLLRFLRKRKIRCALFTGKGIHTATITMQAFALMPYFDYVVTGNDVVNHKPAPEGIEKILDHFKLHKDEVLMVGDSVGDVKAAREAGVKIAVVLWDSYSKEKVLLMKTDYAFHTVTEFSLWLRDRVD